MAFFGLIFGFGFYTATRDMVRFSFQAQMMGQQQQMNVNEQIIRPLLGFAVHGRAVPDPHDHDADCSPRRSARGTIELLLTSPVKDIEIIIGKWLGAMLLYLCVLAMSMINIAMLFAWGKPDLKPVLVAYLGLILQGGCLLAVGVVHLHHHAQPDHRRRRHFFCLPAAVAAELVHGVRHTGAGAGGQLPLDRHPLREFQ